MELHFAGKQNISRETTARGEAPAKPFPITALLSCHKLHQNALNRNMGCDREIVMHAAEIGVKLPLG